MFWIIFIFLQLAFNGGSVAAPCDSSKYVWNSSWWNGAGGTFFINFPNGATNGWSVSVTFSSPIDPTQFQVWNGGNIVCSSSTSCSFGNATWNPTVAAGTTLSLGFQVVFSGSLPSVTSISLGSLSICGGSSGPTTSTTTTKPPPTTTTTTKAPGSTTTTKSTASTTTTTTTATTKTTTTTATSTTTKATNNNGRGVFVQFPNKVMGLYLALADDGYPSYSTSFNWTPQLYSYQQTAFNVLYLSFINPSTMIVPQSFINLAKSRGTTATGAVPKTTMIVFALGGAGYSTQYNPWPWLTSQSAAEAMAQIVATWPNKYGCDGIDLDIESGAGDDPNSGVNMVFFIKKLRSLVPNIYIGQPTYGYPQVLAEDYVINQSWDANGKSYNLVDSIGLMVYDGTSLTWVKSYTNGPDQWNGFPITCRAPSNTIINGANGTASVTGIQTLATATINLGYRGIMVWYASVQNGLVYDQNWDTSFSTSSQQAFGAAMTSFNSLG